MTRTNHLSDQGVRESPKNAPAYNGMIRFFWVALFWPREQTYVMQATSKT